MAGYTSAMCGSAKAEMASGMHCFLATASAVAATTANASTSVTGTTCAGLVLGMAVTGTNIAANTVIGAITSTTALTLSIAATGTNPSGLTFTADVFKVALGIPAPTGTYGASSTNYSNLTGNSDEVSGAGYTATGQVLANNISPTNTAGNAFWQWSVNPSWTAATISARACMIYNTTARTSVTGRSIAVFDFGGTQTVTAGTLTLLQPSNAASTSLLQLN